MQPNSLAAETCSLKCTSFCSKLWRCIRSPPEYSFNNMTIGLNTKSAIYKKTEIFHCPSRTPLPSSPDWDCSLKACGVMCTAGICKLQWNSVKQTKSVSISPLSVLTRDQKQKCWHVKKRKKNRARFDNEIKWNFYCIGSVFGVSHAGCAAA